MKKLLLFLIPVLLLIGFSSCSDVATQLTEADAARAVEVVTAAVGGSIYGENARSVGEAGAKASASFTYTQEGGGTATFTYTDPNTDIEGLDGAYVFSYNVAFDNYKVEYTEDNGSETVYTLDGTIYMEYTLSVDEETSAYSYGFYLFTTTMDTLSITGGGLNTALNLNIESSTDMVYNQSEGTYSITYSYLGSCNGQIFDEESGTISGVY